MLQSAAHKITPSLASFVLAILAALLWAGALVHPAAIPVALAVTAIPAAYLVVRYNAENSLLKLIAFFLPFSVEIPFLSGSMLRLPTEPLIALGAMVVLFHLASTKSWTSNALHKEALWLTPLLLVFLISSTLSGMHLVSIKFSAVNFAYAATFYLLVIYVSGNNPQLFPRLLLIYSAGFLIVTLWSIYQYRAFAWNPVVIPGIFEPFYKDHTIFGASAALLAAFWFAFAFTVKRSKLKWLLWMLAAILFMAVIYSTSRGAFISLLVFLPVFLAFQLKSKIKYAMPLLLLALPVLFIIIPVLQPAFTGSQSLSYDSEAGLIDRTASVANISTDVSNLERLNRWHAAWMMFREKPLTGFGPGTYQFEYIPYQSQNLMNRLSVTNPYDIPEGSGGTAHSEYLLALSEMGIFGLAAWLLLLGRWPLLSVRRWHTHPRQKFMAVAMAALSTYYFHALVNNFLTTDKFAFLFWGTAAWLVANWQADEKVLAHRHADIENENNTRL